MEGTVSQSFPNRSWRLAAALLLIAGLAGAQTRVKPGFNLFSPEQDIQLGQEAVKEIEKEVEIVNDSQLSNYIAAIGKRLSDVAPGEKYPYSFKVVAEPSINAFALPGGPMYVHSGLIAAADNEAQLAGVMAHEISHVALRHSTNQASKAKAFQIPLVLAGGLLQDKGGMLPALAELGVGFGLNSVFMKYSRDAEKQADLLGAQMMAQVGYDPVEMARFFEKLEAEGGSRTPQFFSDHPNPGNRVKYVQEEVKQLPSRNYTTGNAGDFARMKDRAAKVPPPKKKVADAAAPASNQPSGSPTVAGQFQQFRGSGYEFGYPSSWQAHEMNRGAAVTITPSDGVTKQSNGNPALTTGVMAGYFEPKNRNLRAATDQLIGDLQSSNKDLKPVRGKRESISVNGKSGQSVLLEGPSALQGRREFVWLVTSDHPNGFYYLVFVSPDNRYNELRPHFQQMVQSVRFN
jgi:hypothetical protein